MSERAFRETPQAELLEVFADFEAPLGVAYQRCLLFEKPEHALERTVICFPRGATRAVSRIAATGELLSNDTGNAVIKAAGVRQSVRSLTAVYDDLALLPDAPLVRDVARESGLGEQSAARFLAFSGEVPRTPWLRELVEQFFQRRVLQREPAARLVFFAREIIRELILLVDQQSGRRESAANVEPKRAFESPPLAKAIAFLESHLFDEVAIDALAEYCAASVSTLNRLFRAHLRLTPAAYQRERRLEEADRLLRTRSGLSVEQAAYLVGYESPSAFCRSYRRKFGHSPRASVTH